jgi:toxin ParE1/3/4
MSRSIFWSHAAESDLDEIWLSIALNDVLAADRQVDRIAEMIFKLADFPRLGRDRQEFGDSIRSLTKDQYVVLYELFADHRVEIKRIINGRRDLTNIDFHSMT